MQIAASVHGDCGGAQRRPGRGRECGAANQFADQPNSARRF